MEFVKIIISLYYIEEEIKIVIDYFDDVFKKGKLLEIVLELVILVECNMLKEIILLFVKDNYVNFNKEFRRFVD